ncbi:IclR family transcriptional regulator [Nocardioides sp. AN3]
MSDAEVASDGAQGSRDDRAAVDKAMCLLLAFGDEAASGIGVSELARRVNLSKSTAFRLLAMLERNGVVEKFGTQYRLGGRLHELGRDVYSPHHDRVRDLLIPFLGDLYERTHHTVHLAALHGTDVVYLAKLHGHRRPSCPSRIGGRVPAHATAVGKALLAHDADASERALSAELPAFTPTTLTQAAELSTELERIRRAGVAYDREEVQPGLHCVAVPLLTPSGRPIAAFSVSVSSAAELAQVEPILRQIAGEATRFLARHAAARRSRVA